MPISREQLYWVYQSINQKIRLPSNWLNRIQIKDYKNVKGSFIDWVNPLFAFLKWRLSFI